MPGYVIFIITQTADRPNENFRQAYLADTDSGLHSKRSGAKVFPTLADVANAFAELPTRQFGGKWESLREAMIQTADAR